RSRRPPASLQASGLDRGRLRKDLRREPLDDLEQLVDRSGLNLEVHRHVRVAVLGEALEIAEHLLGAPGQRAPAAVSGRLGDEAGGERVEPEPGEVAVDALPLTED